MKNKNIKETINNLRKTIIELLKNGAENAAYIFLKLLEALFKIVIAAAIIFVFSGVTIIIDEVVKAYKDVNKIFNSQVQEGKILGTEISTSYSSNRKIINLDKVIIDSNNNGIKDSDDIELDGKLFSFGEPKEGDTLFYLKRKEKQKETYLPLAIGNEKGDFNIIKIPSNYYNNAQETAKKLDNELFNKIFAEIKEKAPRE